MKGHARAWGRWLLRSLASRLILLSVVFVAVPVLVYDEFRSADAENQILLLRSTQEQGQIIARALQPQLESATAADLTRLGGELARFSDDRLRLKLLLRPTQVAGAQGFFYVGAAPAVPVTDLDQERLSLVEHGILDHLAETCGGNQPLALRVARASGGQEVLSSITPVNTRYGCWAVITSHATPAFLGSSIGQPYWRTPVVQAAALIYLGMAALVLVLFLDIWRNLDRFGRLAKEIRSRETPSGSFTEQNTVPELSSVAESFDKLVDSLHQSATSLRRAAEDNAHAFKTPIAVIRQSVEPLRRIVPAADARGQRAMTMIERSVDRLDGLVSFARKMDEATADVLEPPRRKVDLSALVDRMVGGYAGLLAERRIHVRPYIERGLIVCAGEDLLETVAENIIENAISFSPPDGNIHIRLYRRGSKAEMEVEDDGPGVEPSNLARIFERYFSQRPNTPIPEEDTPVNEAPHFGIGLWIVRRNVDAIGGAVIAENRHGGGLRMKITMPLAR